VRPWSIHPSLLFPSGRAWFQREAGLSYQSFEDVAMVYGHGIGWSREELR
jgi:hypothetical protein